MHIEFSKKAMFGGVKVLGAIDDDRVKVGNKSYRLSQIFAVERSVLGGAISFCGILDELNEEELLKVFRELHDARPSATDQGDWALIQNQFDMLLLLSKMYSGKYKSFNDCLVYGAQESEGREGYEWIRQHSRCKELNDIFRRTRGEKTEAECNTQDETRKQCNVCGTVFCYSAADVKANTRQAKANVFRGMMQAGGLMSGNMGASIYGNQAMKETIDFTRCPSCNSADLSDYTGRILGSEADEVGASRIVTSAADEIRKFKDLLDDGIITKEEFAAKKKQLLGL